MTSSAASGPASYYTNVSGSHNGLLYVYKVQQDTKMKDRMILLESVFINISQQDRIMKDLREQWRAL
jgi:hypothetical protein